MFFRVRIDGRAPLRGSGRSTYNRFRHKRISNPAEQGMSMNTKPKKQTDQTIDHSEQAVVETSCVHPANQETVSGPQAGRTAGPVALKPGDKLGRYEILNELGRCGMGAVYLAHDPTLGRKVAVKIPFLTTNNADEVLHRFQREARAVAALQHPNICPVHEVTEVDGIHFMVMAFIEGHPLSEHLQKAKRLKVTSAVNLVRKLALTLDEAHRKGVVHRDLKPANIMIDARNEPQIMDFGLARLDNVEASQLTAMGQILGTPAYMPPEQVGGNIDATGPASDIYSLGVMLYEMLTGSLPFQGDLMTLMFKIANETRPLASSHREGIPGWLDAVCAKALAKKPEQRFGSMREFAAALQGQASPAEFTETLAVGTHAASAVPAVSLPNLTIDTSPTRKPIVSSRGGNRNTKIYKWIAAAAALPLFLLAGGWIIKITNSDGTERKIIVAADAKIEITPNDKQATRTRATKPGAGLAISKWPDDAPKLAIAPFDAGQAAQHQAAWAKYLGVPVEFTNSIGMKFRLIPPGQFTMGSTQQEVDRAIATDPENYSVRCARSELPQHSVILTQPFYVSITEVTQRQYEAVTKVSSSKPIPENKESPDLLPVDKVSFENAAEFCNQLAYQEQLGKSERDGGLIIDTAAANYRLPTEAEWEYACRAGTETIYYFGNDATDVAKYAWTRGNSDNRSHPVGELKPNMFGLYDMCGNLWEWTEDFWDPISYQSHSKTAVIDPLPVGYSVFGRSVRGGNWNYGSDIARSAARRDISPDSKFGDIGIRVVMSVDAAKIRALFVQSPARAAATRILQSKGRVGIKKNDGGEEKISDLGSLPSQDFVITKVWLNHEHDNGDCLQLLRHMATVTQIDMDGDAVPLSIEDFKQIETLQELEDLSLKGSTYLDDDCFHELSRLEKLKRIIIWDSKLTDAAFANLSRFTNASFMQFGASNTFNGSGLSKTSAMPSVVELSFGRSSFGDQGMQNLSCFPNLERIDVDGSQVTDDGVRKLPVLKNLKRIGLFNNKKITGSSLSSLAKFPSLTELNLHSTGIDDDGLEKLHSMRHLTVLEINDCPVTSEAVDRLQDALPSCRIVTNALPTGGWPAGLWFDGDDHIQTGLTYGGSTPLTIEATTSLSGYSDSLVANFENSGIGLECKDDSWTFQIRTRGEYYPVRSTSFVKLRRTIRIAGVYDGKTATLFLDGHLENDVNVGRHDSSDFPFQIGGDPDGRGGSTNHYCGVIQSVRISNTARYTADYDASKPYEADDATLLMLDFTRPDSEVAKDMSKYNVPCKVIGATRPPKL